MAYDSTWGAGPAGYASGGEWASRPRYTPADFITLLWRDRWLMIAVFAVIFILGVLAAFSMKTQYPAHSSILVRLGQEYVYEPSVGDAARGAIPTNDQLIQSEVEILSSPELRRRVVEGLGVPKLFPDKAEDYAKAPAAKKKAMMDEAVAGMGSALKVEATPDVPVLRLTYSDTDPVRAALVLNRLLDEYLVYRRSVLAGADEPVLRQQLKVFEDRLAETDTQFQTILMANGIEDFEAEKTSLNALQSSLTDEGYRVQARLKEIDGRLGEIGRQMGRLSPEVSLYQDSNPATSDKLLQLQIERQDLLSRYRPDSQPVRDLDQKIAQLQALMGQVGGQSAGARRTGVNPVFQAVQTEQIQLSAESASLKERQSALGAQATEVAGRRQKLTEMEPEYLGIARDRDLLQNEVRSLTQKLQQAQAMQSIAQKTNDNIRIVERPSPPREGKSLKKPILALAFLFAGFTALCIGLLRVFLRRGFATPACASRTLDLPVLAAAGLKRDV